MPGYLEALESAQLLYEVISTYRPGSMSGKFLPAVHALGPLSKSVRQLRRRGVQPVVYGHAGAWPAILREGLLLLISRLLGARTMLQLHSPKVDRYLDRPLGVALMHLVAKTSRILVLTPWWQKRLAERGLNATVIPNPLPLACEAIARSNQESGPVSEVRVLTMCRLVPGKGVEAVMQAIARLDEPFRLTVAGDGFLRRHLEALAIELSLTDRVHFAGWVDEHRKHELLASSDIFCLPSAADSFGMVFVEAMSHGIPVVALDWGPIADVVPPEKAGLLVPHQNAECVADALLRLKDRGLRQTLGRFGRRHVLETFSVPSIGARLREVVRSLQQEA